jgi:hypothetical protein
MVYFVSYKNFSDFVAYYANQHRLELYPELTRFGTSIVGLQSWGDWMKGAESESLFVDESDAGVRSQVYDYSSLTLSPAVKEQFEKLSQTSDVYMINREDSQLKAPTKKLLQSKNIAIIELKGPDKLQIKNLIQASQQVNSTQLASEITSFITNESKNWDQVMGLLYLAEMLATTKTPTSAIISVLQESLPYEATPLFQLPWRENMLAKDVISWSQAVGPDELQLALSLLMTKTLNWRDGQRKTQMIQKIINTDQQLKNYVRSDTSYFRGFLWSVGRDV